MIGEVLFPDICSEAPGTARDAYPGGGQELRMVRTPSFSMSEEATEGEEGDGE